MAAGAAPAPQKDLESKTETAETAQSRPLTFKQRLMERLHEIFRGRDEYLGWRQ
jgi:hypothetical protein